MGLLFSQGGFDFVIVSISLLLWLDFMILAWCDSTWHLQGPCATGKDQRTRLCRQKDFWTTFGAGLNIAARTLGGSGKENRAFKGRIGRDTNRKAPSSGWNKGSTGELMSLKDLTMMLPAPLPAAAGFRLVLFSRPDPAFGGAGSIKQCFSPSTAWRSHSSGRNRYMFQLMLSLESIRYCFHLCMFWFSQSELRRVEPLWGFRVEKHSGRWDCVQGYIRPVVETLRGSQSLLPSHRAEGEAEVSKLVHGYAWRQ